MTITLKRACICLLMSLVGFALPSSGKSDPEANAAERAARRKTKGSGKEMLQGGKDIGKGAGKGTKDLAEGSAGSVTDLATGHPVGATAALGKGVGGFGKNTGVGAGKGAARIGKGLGGETKKLGKKMTKRDNGLSAD